MFFIFNKIWFTIIITITITVTWQKINNKTRGLSKRRELARFHVHSAERFKSENIFRDTTCRTVNSCPRIQRSLLTPWGRVLPEKLKRHKLLKKFLAFYGTRIHKSPPPVPILSQMNPVYAPHPTSRRSILILSSHLCLGLPSGLLPSGFPTKELGNTSYVNLFKN
jgi:hypothetical protein